MEKKWFIGIDISKKLDVVIYVPTKKHADETNYERFLNKEEGYKSLLCWLKKKNMAKKRLVISMENTGIYSFDLCLFLEAASIDYCSFNPLHLKRSLGLVRGKNDRVDAERIAYLLIFIGMNYLTLSCQGVQLSVCVTLLQRENVL